jgi:hypothetical protein
MINRQRSGKREKIGLRRGGKLKDLEEAPYIAVMKIMFSNSIPLL